MLIEGAKLLDENIFVLEQKYFLMENIGSSIWCIPKSNTTSCKRIHLQAAQGTR